MRKYVNVKQRSVINDMSMSWNDFFSQSLSAFLGSPRGPGLFTSRPPSPVTLRIAKYNNLNSLDKHRI